MKESRSVGILLFALVAQLVVFRGTAAAQSDPCRVGQELEPGDYCTVDIPGINLGGNRFEVQADGSALLGTSRFSRSRLNIGGFRASPIGTLQWRIDAVPGGGGANRPPRPTGSIPAQALTVGGASASVDVAPYFTDPDGDALSYSASSNRNGIARASSSGSAVTVTPASAGTATVTVTARDPAGASATQSIAVTVEEDGGANRAPQPTGSIPAQALTVGGRAESVSVAPYFTDPDGDALTYVVRSSQTGIVSAVVAGSTVMLTPVAAGTATVTVTARDPGGLSATQSIAVTVQAAGGVNGFTDDPLVPGVTRVRAVHFRELRTRIDALRTGAGLSAYAWTNPALTPGVTRVRSVHLTELRTALNEAYSAAGQPRPSYTNAAVRAGTTPIRAAHVTELRSAVVELENAAPTGLMPDLVVGAPAVDDSTLTPGQSFTFSVTVRNRGSVRAAATTLRYYRSTNSTISASDTAVGTDHVSALASGASGAESISLTAPSSVGTYYYGACVAPVNEESDAGNNCSAGVRVIVESGGGGQALTGEITTCSGTRTVGTVVNVVITGTVTARRAVSFLTLTGRANGDFVGIQFIGTMSAGQTEDFRITGIISTSASTLRCTLDAEFRVSSAAARETGESISVSETGPVR